VRVTRRRHPLQGQELRVLRGGPRFLLVRLVDGTVMRLPREFTDASGMVEAAEPSGDSAFTTAALRELMVVVDELLRRTLID